MSEDEDIKNSVIDQVHKVIERSKDVLSKVECPQHGKALEKLDFDPAKGRFDIKTCCDQGEALVMEAMNKL